LGKPFMHAQKLKFILLLNIISTLKHCPDTVTIWTLSAMTSQNKNDGNSGGLCTEWYRKRWLLAMITFTYCSKEKGELYILTYKTNVCSFACISKLRSGFAWLDYFASHHGN